MNSLQLSDEDTNYLFERIRDILIDVHRYSIDQADTLCRSYYRDFTDEAYCEKIGIPVQDDDYFHHESPHGMALRIHYYLGLQKDPSPYSFIEWRADYYRLIYETKRSNQ
jgi:hypothetical protein